MPLSLEFKRMWNRYMYGPYEPVAKPEDTSLYWTRHKKWFWSYLNSPDNELEGIYELRRAALLKELDYEPCNRFEA